MFLLRVAAPPQTLSLSVSLSHQIVDFSAVSFSEEQKKDNVKQQTSSRRTVEI